MAYYQQNPILKERAARERGARADRFWQSFLMTENGKLKSTLLMNSFCLCFVFIAVYGIAFALLIDPLHALTCHFPTLIESLVGAIVPAALGTAVCCLTWPLCKEKRVLPAAFLWMLLWALACLITLLLMLRGEPEARNLFLQFFVLFVPAPVLMGSAVSLRLYFRYWKQGRQAEK